MNRYSASLLALFVLVGCGGGSNTNNNNGGGGAGGGGVPQAKLDSGACAGTSSSECAGGVCISLLSNDQHESGICTTACTSTCATGEFCASGFPDGGSYCLRSCTSGADCVDGFACVQDPSTGLAFCWVTTTGAGGGGGGGGGGTGGHADCTGCDILDISYCNGVAGATQACDCPNGSPSTSCSAAAGAANVWCCP
jgi:hypothetical protein